MNINETLKNDYDLLCKEYKKAIKKIEKLEKQKEYLTTQQLLEELQKRLDHDSDVSEELAAESNELQKRIDKAIEYIEDKNIVVGTDIEGDLYSSKDILIGILKGE